MQRTLAIRRPWTPYLWLPLCLLLTDCKSTEPGPGDAKYEEVAVAGQGYEAMIADDQIGVLLEDGFSPERLEGMAGASGLQLAESFAGGILVYQLSASQPRADLRALALQLARDSDAVRIAGLVVRQKDEETPLVLTEELVVQLDRGAAEQRALDLFQAESLTLVRRNPFRPEQYLVTIDASDPRDCLRAAAEIHERPEVVLAQPNFVRVKILREWIPNDPLFGDQWHHDNTGQGGGTVDADIDATLAWDFTTGAAGTVVAVIDDGFDTAHADLAPNAWTNPGETAANGIDDDGNGFIDDVLGWDFLGSDASPTPGMRGVFPDDHGTAVAGCAAAAGNNATGVTGSCPDCGLMFLRYGSSDFDDGMAFDYAQAMGADVITNSWGYWLGAGTNLVQNAINDAATNGRGGLGCVILFAMNNADWDDCIGASPDISSMANVIAVSGASNQDRKVVNAAWGDCMDVIAPTHRGYGPTDPYVGTLNIVTTDRTGNAGYNGNSPVDNCPSTEPTAPPADAQSYTYCFGGTSAATPISAGVCGLLLELDPGLSRVEVQRLLQDTCDKVEDSAGAYSTETSFSDPSGSTATHGFGRVNAFEAARTVAGTPAGGRGGVDVFLRDNRLDWGNTEQRSNVLFEPTRGFLGHWKSVDVRVDAPPFVGAAPSDPATFDAFAHEQAIAETTNRVYVRVHNRGPDPAATVTVKLHWVFAGTALPALPSDFWTAFPGDSSDPANPYTTIGVQTVSALAYSGGSVAGGPQDASQILSFDFAAPAIDPAQASPRHHCLFVVLDSPQDPVSALAQSSLVTDFITPRDNNVTHKNLQLADPAHDGGRLEEMLMARNPNDEEVRCQFEVVKPEGWEVALDGLPLGQAFPLAARAEVPVTIRIEIHGPLQDGEVDLIQRRLDGREPEVMGGFTFAFASKQP